MARQMEEISSRQTKKRNSQSFLKRLGSKKGRLVCPSCQLRYIWAYYGASVLQLAGSAPICSPISAKAFITSF
jgi:hypothetical protein